MGVKKNKAEGLLSNSASRRGIGHPGPLDQGWAAQIRRKGERGKPAAGTVLWQGGAPWPTVRRSSASGKQGLRAMVRRNRGSQGREEMKATLPRPRTWPEDTVGGVVAMAGDAKVLGARGLGPRGHET